MRSKIWPWIALSFGMLLLVVGGSAFVAIGQFRQLRAEFIKVDELSREREQAVREIRESLARSSVVLTDALVGTTEVNREARMLLAAYHAAILKGLDRLQHSEDDRQRKLVGELRQLHQEYWNLAAIPLAWPEPERRVRGMYYLRRELAPLRDSVLASSRNIELLENTLLRERRARLDATLQQQDAAITRTLAVALTIGGLLTLLTVWRIARVETQAAVLYLQAESDRQELRLLSQKLVHAQEDERKALSRELHDQIGQLLTAIQMTFTKVEACPSDVARYLEDGKSLTARTIGIVRNISMGLRPSVLDDFGLGPAIQWQTREFTKRVGTRVETRIDGDVEALSEQQKVCLYRVVQESLTNCARHSGASSIQIDLCATATAASLVIQDDGGGFDVRRPARQGLGLFGMRERVRELGGVLSIHSEPAQGTRIQIEIPIGNEAHR